jgi:VIT1/CCC1 family predicted Fe2+/Mn2+ transporter
MRATVRVVLGGIAAMIVTFGIGLLFGVSAG